MEKRRGPEELDEGAGPLFEPHKHARAADPVTSHAAAAKAESLASRHCAEIIALLRQHPRGLTADEIAQRSSALDRVQVGRRMSDLREAGMARESGEARVNKNNRHSLVWVAT